MVGDASHDSYAWRYGTWSKPPAPGRQRSRRRAVSQLPRAAPCRCIALAAYCEQLGVRGQGGVRGLSSAW